MGLFDTVFDFAKKEVGNIIDPKTQKQIEEQKEASEKENFDKFRGHFGHYTAQSFASLFGNPDNHNKFKLEKSQANIHFCQALTTAKKLGYDYFVFVGDNPHQGQAYYGNALDNHYDLSKVSTSNPTATSYNVYPVILANEPNYTCSGVTEAVAKHYTKLVYKNMSKKLNEDIKNIKERQKMTETMIRAYEYCEANKQNNESVERCAQAQYKKNYKHIDSIEAKEAELKNLNDKLNVLRLKNRYETESQNQLSNQKAKNNSFFQSLKNTLTENYNSIQGVNNAILNVSNKLKTNTNIFGMKSNVVSLLTTVAITLIILGLGFLAYFGYQVAKKYFPSTLQGFRAAQASASAPFPSVKPSNLPSSTSNSTSNNRTSNNTNPSNNRTSDNRNNKNKKGFTGLGF